MLWNDEPIGGRRASQVAALKFLVPDKLRVYLTKLCSMNVVWMDSVSLLRLKKTKPKKILTSLLESLRAAVWTDVPVQVMAACTPPPNQTP